jgi:hypothetical protein
MLDLTEKYNVYLYHDPTRGHEPFYVGKGKDNRQWEHLQHSHNPIVNSKIRKIRSRGFEPIIGIYSDLDEELALFLEKELIAKFGKIIDHTGTLANMSDGGVGSSGYKWTTTQKEEHSIRFKGRKQHENSLKALKASVDRQRGVPISVETKTKISETLTGRPSPNRGRAKPEGFGAKISELQKGRKPTEEARKNAAEGVKRWWAKRKQEQIKSEVNQ